MLSLCYHSQSPNMFMIRERKKPLKSVKERIRRIFMDRGYDSKAIFY